MCDNIIKNNCNTDGAHDNPDCYCKIKYVTMLLIYNLFNLHYNLSYRTLKFPNC